MKPGPRANGKPAAKDVSDLAVLESAIGFAVGGLFPLDSLAERHPGLPRKVFVAKARKLEQRGLMKGWALTMEGLEALRKLEEEAE